MSDSVEILKKTDLDASIVSLRSDGILQIFMKPNRTMKLIDGQNMVKAFADLGGGKKYPLLFIAGDFTLANAEARYYAASEEANLYTVAVVFIVNNIAQKIMGNAFITFNKPVKPTKILTSEEEGVKWLKSFM
jgi:hypothetical protein